jgi:UTP-glucose-1-phosphate uridylyltransferase
VIGSSEWSTSIFPDTKRKTFVLPLKKSIREKEALTVGDRPLVQLTLVN